MSKEKELDIWEEKLEEVLDELTNCQNQEKGI